MQRFTVMGGVGVAALAAVTVAALVPTGADAHADAHGTPVEYVTLFAATGERTQAQARTAIEAAGGQILRENPAIGTALVRSDRANFATLVRRSGDVLGAVPNHAIGHAPDLVRTRDLVERLSPAERAAATERFRATAPARAAAAEGGAEPLAGRQWDMQMIGATPAGSYAAERGDPRVTVGIMDTGVDASHPDLAPNFDGRLSKNFVTDLPDADGPCEVTTCQDPADVDDNGHGTHVAGIIGGAINGLGIAGVAPEVTLVSVRAGQDSGYFFLQAVVDALTYSADVGLDVVNMSFYIDPWLFNCAANPGDSPEEQAQQAATVEAVQRAVDYARGHGVTLVGSLGNESTDLGQPSSDDSSPNFPEGSERERAVDNTCLSMPAEAAGVISVAALGPSGRKAYYSNYGIEQNDVSAPGGDAFDTPDFKVDPRGQVLSAYPEALGRASGDIDEQGEPTTPFTVKDCAGGVCAYYQYLQGTSMAAPHAAGVAALVVIRLGLPQGEGSFGLDPSRTEALLFRTATQRPCPTPEEYAYTVDGARETREFTHTCETGPHGNGFYGRGVVSAVGAAGLSPLTELIAPPPVPTT